MPWGPLARLLTVSGNEITDAERAAALSWLTTQQGGSTDGLSVPAGFGVWEAGTNLHPYAQADTNGNYAGNVASASVGAPDASVPFEFTPRSIPVTCAGTVNGEGVIARSFTGQAAAAGTNGVGSIRFKGTNGSQYKALLLWKNLDGSTTTGPQTTFTADGTEQEIGKTIAPLAALAVAAGMTGDMLEIAIVTATQRAETFHVACPMLQKGVNVVSPYVATSGGATATRGASRVQVPSTLLDPSTMCMAFWVEPGWSSASPPGGGTGFPRLFEWDHDGSNRITAYWYEGGKQWAVGSLVGGASDTAASAVQTFDAYAGGVLVVCQLSATQVKISVGGAPSVVVARTHGVPAGLPTTADLGNVGGAGQIDGNIRYAAFLPGINLTDTQIAMINALGSIPPTIVQLGSIVGTGMVHVWPALTAIYMKNVMGTIEAVRSGSWSPLKT